MRILFTVEWYEPRRGGVEEVVRQLAQRLTAKGHQVTVATTAVKERQINPNSTIKVVGFAISGNAARGISGSPEELARYHALLRGQFDVVIQYAAQNWTTDVALPILATIQAKKVLIPCGYSGLQNPKYASYFKALPQFLAQYNALIYMSANYQDKLFGDEHGVGERAVIIPNGAATEEFLAADDGAFMKAAKIQTPKIALTVSNHYRAKGHAFVRRAFAAMKRRDTTLVIIGEVPSSGGVRRIAHLVTDYVWCRLAAFISSRVRVLSGADRALVLSAYKNADIFLFGSEIECSPLVMYESFAAKLPFITRPVGNVGDHAECLRIVASETEMTKRANELLDNPAVSAELADKAFSLWQTHHTWQLIAERYDQLIRSFTHA